MENKIKFSGKYEKLKAAEVKHGDRVVLVSAQCVQLEELPKDFLKYDMEYLGGFGHYPLPAKGKFILLLFVAPLGCGVFTTLRRWTPRKWKYYGDGVGGDFQVEILEARI